MKLFLSLLLCSFVFILAVPAASQGQTTPPDTSIDDMQNGTMADPTPQPRNTGSAQDEVPPNREVPAGFGETPNAASSQEQPAQSGTTDGGYTFVPLTGLPGVQSVSQSNSISNFLNSLYRICIGLAAVLAVIQITRAGIVYMLQDSVTEKKDAKHLIQMSLFGLLLVLSPTIVFGIIDPRILSLDINAEGLKFKAAAPIGTNTQTGNENNLPTAEDAAISAESCGGQPLTQTEAACIRNFTPPVVTEHPDGSLTKTGPELQDCLPGRSLMEIQCILTRAAGNDPSTGADINMGTYIGYATFAGYMRNGVAVTKEQARQEWISSSCSPPKQATVRPSGMVVCVVPIRVDMIRRTDGNILSQLAQWEPRTSTQRRARDTFKSECTALALRLNGPDRNITEDLRRSVIVTHPVTEHVCTSSDLANTGIALPRSDQTFICSTDAYSCDPDKR